MNIHLYLPVFKLMSDAQFSLSEYLSAVKEVIQLAFDDAVWVKAEIRNLNIKGGHYYLELAEKEQDSDKVIASCKATIWKFTAAKVVGKFERESGIELSRDLNVLVKVRARFDPQYGFSVNIEEIDSSFTLGDLARRYQQIIEKLSIEGLIHKNQQLPAPFDINQVLVIAPENAAGLGDFKGNTAAQSIQTALAQALRQWANDYNTAPDLIAIIRGGGAVNDLAYLNDYDLAALLCKRSVPIWVGIGHEKDQTILDEIAHRSFDTPSKVIGGIRNHIVERSQEVLDALQSIQLHSQHQIAQYQSQNDQLMQVIKTLAQTQINDGSRLIQQFKDNTAYFAQLQLKTAAQNIEVLMRETLLQNPAHVLSKGYAIVRQNGKALRSAQQLDSTTTAPDIQIEMQDGLITAKIQQIQVPTDD